MPSIMRWVLSASVSDENGWVRVRQARTKVARVAKLPAGGTRKQRGAR